MEFVRGESVGSSLKSMERATVPPRATIEEGIEEEKKKRCTFWMVGTSFWIAKAGQQVLYAFAPERFRNEEIESFLDEEEREERVGT